jgi:hypothetical protein
MENSTTLGIEVPICYKTQEANMIAFLKSEENLVLNRESSFGSTASRLDDAFFREYPGGLKNFYDELLRQKDINSNPKATKFGLGDITFSLNRRMENKENWTLGLLGLAVTIPSETAASQKFVWPVHLGNGGFWSAKLNGALYWKKSNLFNPHLLSQFTFFFPGSVERRVSRLISYNKESRESNFNCPDLPLGQELDYNLKTFINEPESTISAFAAAPTQFIEYRPGPTISLRLGNIFDQLILEDGYLDLYSDILFKFADSSAKKTDTGLLDLDLLTQRTENWSIKIGAAYVYQWKDFINFEIKASTVVAGRSVLREANISISSQYRF